MIDINELRRLAQAATKGPWVSQGRYIGTPHHMSYIGEVRDQCGNWSDTEKSRSDAAYIAAANPATVSELINRIEAAESDAIEQSRLNGMGASREAALMAKLEAAEKDIALKERVIDSLGSELNAVASERDTLRAKVEAMEQQEPVATVRINAINGNPSVDFVPGHRYLHHNDKLYLTPGAQPAPSVPKKIKRVESGFKGMFLREAQAYKQGWNECRAVMIAATSEKR